MKNRVKSSKIELRFREVRSEGCTSCTPVQQALIYPVSQTWQFCFGRTAFLLLFFLLNWEARRPERQAGPCASPVPPTTKKSPDRMAWGSWWSIVHGTRTQHFLTGDRFGIIREVDIENDPVIKDVDRVDRRRTQAAPPHGPRAGTRTRPSRLLRLSRNCPHQCSQSIGRARAPGRRPVLGAPQS